MRTKGPSAGKDPGVSVPPHQGVHPAQPFTPIRNGQIGGKVSIGQRALGWKPRGSA